MGALLEILYDIGWLEFVDRISKGKPSWVWLFWAFSPLLALATVVVAWMMFAA